MNGLSVVVAVVGVVLALATDDREPSIVLAWLFVILLVPIVGVVAYAFVGRNHRRESRRRSRIRSENLGRAARALGPVVEGQTAWSAAAVSRRGTEPLTRPARARPTR